MSEYSTEIIRRIYDDKEGTCIEVLPEDGGVRIRTPNDASTRMYGNLDITLPAELVLKLGLAMKRCAEEELNAL